MTEVRVGYTYIANKVKAGSNAYGDWELLVVKSPGRRQPVIAISVINVPSGINYTGAFKIREIRSVMHRMWKSAVDGEYRYGNVTVKAVVEPVFDYIPPEKPKKEDDDDIFTGPQFPSLEDWFN